MRTFLTTVMFVAIAAAVSAQDFNKGLAAAQSGDFATALKEWTPLAEQGNVHAQSNLALMYIRGDGVTQDYKKALKWYTLAAEQGSAKAQSNLALMYRRGEGIPQDHKEAVKWFTLAAEQGNDTAQFYLGYIYSNGEGVSVDDEQSVKWYSLAAEQVNSSAQTNLGWMYENGRGVPRDNILAHMWYSLGAVNGNELGGDNRDVLAESMSFWEVLQAKGLFNKCINTNYSDCGYNELQATGYFKNEKPDGLWEHYHENGRLESKGNYKQGKKDGLWQFFNEDGTLEKTETYKDGELTEETNLLVSQLSALRDSIQSCWIVPFDDESKKIVVEVGVAFTNEGKIISGSMRLVKYRGGSEEGAKLAFQSARRAMLRCQKDGYKSLPKSYAGEEIIIVFDPTGF